MSDDWNNATPAAVARNGERGRRNASALLGPNSTLDALPPHSEEAERGVLGCILLAPMENIPKARKRLAGEDGAEFYVLALREIWLALCRMLDDRLAGKPICSNDSADQGIDLITLQQRLKDVHKLAEVGGLAFLSSLPDEVPGPSNLDYYLEIVAEQFAAREAIQKASTAAAQILQFPGQTQLILHRLQDELAVVARLAAPPEAAEKMYLRPQDMGDEFWQRWFGRHKGVHGLPMPDLAFGNFPFLIRTRELTLLEAETKMGKSTLASYVITHLLNHGMRAVIDSREVHYADTMKKLVMQLTGVNAGHLCIVGEEQVRKQGFYDCQCETCAQATALFGRAIGWLNERVLVNRTTGIKHWRDLLDAFHELAGQGYNFFLLDSLMRIGIADDDFTQQAACVSSFAQFAIETNSAMWLINHRNKGDGDYRKKSGGSYKVAANASNICSVVKNEKKFEKLAADFDSLRNKVITWAEFLQLDNVKKWLPQHDAKFFVHDQRLDGTRSNAARELWFLKRSGQYFDHRHPRPSAPVNWLQEWTGGAGVSPVSVPPGVTPEPSNDDVAENFPEGETELQNEHNGETGPRR